MPELEKCVNKFHGGNISSQILNWKRITKDKVILDIIQHGLKLQVDEPVTMPLLNTQDLYMKQGL